MTKDSINSETSSHTVHTPVMMENVLEHLHLEKGMTVVDATLGGGGYTRALHDAVMPGGRVISFDADASAIARFEDRCSDIAKNISLVHSNFRDIDSALTDIDVDKVDAIVADLGLSSDHFDTQGRGFSFKDAKSLDMRLDQTAGIDAATFLAKVDEDSLTRIIAELGDERFARRSARAIIENRPFESACSLAETISDALGRYYRDAHIHPATKSFQAIRMHVNDELGAIECLVRDGFPHLKVGGRMAIVTFHSGEDRVVKNMFRELVLDCECPAEFPICVCKREAQARLITRKPELPTVAEVDSNPRARSAKLRVAEKV